MEYPKYKASDFAADEFFCKWILSNDSDINTFFINLLQNNAHLIKEAESGRQIILAMANETCIEISADTIDSMWNNIAERINADFKSV